MGGPLVIHETENDQAMHSVLHSVDNSLTKLEADRDSARETADILTVVLAEIHDRVHGDNCLALVSPDHHPQCAWITERIATAQKAAGFEVRS